MSDFPLVSIGIATFNGIETVNKALNSALNQDYPNFEVIISDDHSNDGTWEFIQKFKDVAKIVRQPSRIGRSNNYNYLLDLSQGEYFLLMDQDDERDFSFITAAVQKFQSESHLTCVMPRVDVIYKGALQHSNYYEYLNPSTFNRFWSYIKSPHDFLPYGLLLNREFKTLGGFDKDNFYFHKLSVGLILKGKVACVENVSFKYNAKGFKNRPSQTQELLNNSVSDQYKQSIFYKIAGMYLGINSTLCKGAILNNSLKIMCFSLLWWTFFYKSTLKILGRFLICLFQGRLPKKLIHLISEAIYPTNKIHFKTDRTNFESGYYAPHWPIY